jgi:hypothetical protein
VLYRKDFGLARLPPEPKAAGSSPAGDINSWRPRTYNSSQ